MRKRKSSNPPKNEEDRSTGESSRVPVADDCLSKPNEDMSPQLRSKSAARRKTVCIVVLGDIGRSPRMRYHAGSFAKEGCDVVIIGYGGSGPLPLEIQENPFISTVKMSEPPSFLQRVPRLLAYPLKMAWLAVVLTFAFLKMAFYHLFFPDIILLQNPPAIPSLALCWMYSKIFVCDFIVDWHNYGYTIMSLVMKKEHPLIKFATWFENYFGSKADHHLCVTRAMKDDLNERLGVSPVVLYDRPPDQFQSMSQAEQQECIRDFRKRYFPDLPDSRIKDSPSRNYGIIVSSTSWTEDEDFGILLKALESYQKTRSRDPDNYPILLVLITGKGPQRDYYIKEIRQLNLQDVFIYSVWLEHQDYPKLLACADLGISLHYSSSGLDLPMKVVDMFGCGLPVAAIDFNCISELVQHNVNGLIFKNSDQLALQIQDWFRGFPNKPNENHRKFRKNIETFQNLRWHENWSHNVKPLLKD